MQFAVCQVWGKKTSGDPSHLIPHLGCPKLGIGVQNREKWVCGAASPWKTKAIFFPPPHRGFLAGGADPSPSAGPCQAALISPSSGEDNACLGRVPPVTSARACQREPFALYCSQMLFVSLPQARAPAETRGACRGESPKKTQNAPKCPSGSSRPCSSAGRRSLTNGD